MTCPALGRHLPSAGGDGGGGGTFNLSLLGAFKAVLLETKQELETTGNAWRTAFNFPQNALRRQTQPPESMIRQKDTGLNQSVFLTIGIGWQVNRPGF